MAEIVRIDGGTEPPATPSLPQNIEAEAALLGALMIDNRLVEDVQLKLKALHFFEPLHGRIFDADEAMKEVGGPAYLAQLTGSGAAIIGARDFATQIYDLALLRALIGVGRELVEGALDTSEEVAPLAQIERAETELYKVAEEGGNDNKVKSFGEATRLALEMAERALNSGGHLSGVTTGIDGINSKIGGLHRSDLTILAGRPGMGKTSLATNIAFSAAQRFSRDIEDGIDPTKSAGAGVAFFSLEMSADQLATRILAEQSGISSENLRMGKISQQDFRNLARAAGELQGLPLYIDDTPGLTIAALRARARRLKRQKGIGMVVVDYLQLLQGTGKNGAAENRVQEISEISRGLKQLAKELDLPVLALSQLSRAVEQREDKRPQLSDLRESGSIEQDADIVMFIYREQYYAERAEPTQRDGEDDNKFHERLERWKERCERAYGKAEIIVAKQRHGPIGSREFAFDGDTTRFSDLVADDHLPAHY